jgi:hypothetical protein
MLDSLNSPIRFRRLRQIAIRRPVTFVTLAPCVVGLVFLVAGFLKAHDFWETLPSYSGILGSWQFQFALIEIEVALGWSLFFGLLPGFSRSSVIVVLSIFVVWNVSQAIMGARTCACFGKIDLHPWLTAIADSVLLLLMWRWHPGETKGTLICILTAVPILVASAMLIAVEKTSLIYPQLLGAPTQVDLGTLQQGGKKEFALYLRNPHAQPVVISHIDVTCPCLIADMLPRQVYPNQESHFCFTLDLSKEPNFIGDLRIKLKGGAETGDFSWWTEIRVKVGVDAQSQYEVPF